MPPIRAIPGILTKLTPGLRTRKLPPRRRNGPIGHLVSEDRTESEELSKYHGKLSIATVRGPELAEPGRGPSYQL